MLIRSNIRIMDVVSDILRKVKLSSAIYFKSDFSSPWGMKIPQGPFAQFHIVTSGQCLLSMGGQKQLLREGDIVVFPMGIGHWIADNEASDKKNGQEVVQSIVGGDSLFKGDLVSTSLICGHFEFDRKVIHPLLRALPEIIHIKNTDREQLSWLEGIINLIIQETEGKNSGSSIITDKLGEVLFVHTLRAYIQQNKNQRGFIAAIQDERIRKAIEAIHYNPQQHWKLSTLAQICGMSRTSFSNKFKALLGETPLSYLRNWRILQAKELLTDGTQSVGEIAEYVGYQSEAAFNRVFKKQVSQTPLKYRQASLQA